MMMTSSQKWGFRVKNQQTARTCRVTGDHKRAALGSGIWSVLGTVGVIGIWVLTGEAGERATIEWMVSFWPLTLQKRGGFEE